MAALLLALTALPAAFLLLRPAATVDPPAATLPQVTRAAAAVWQVETNADAEIYSNGLRIDTHFTVAHRPRAYLAFPLRGATAVARSQPAGIVFHTTESPQVPFEAGQNRMLKRLGESLLDYVRRRKAYHFLIDRFGRVYRIVRESDAANHAGYSVWSDERCGYVNLNESFLGVSFEAETRPGQVEAEISPAQVRAAAMLTEVLRCRYGIAAENCVTHAQVSVNPSNMRAGYHTDWASSFPFEGLGLPDNYRRALPAVAEFGFECDPVFFRRTGVRMHLGVELAEESVRKNAAHRGLRVQAYRRMLREHYRKMLAQVRE